MDYLGTEKAPKLHNDAKVGMKKTKKFITTRLGLIGVGIISLIWLFWGYFEPYHKEEPLWVILISSSVSMAAALSIGSLLRYQGVLTGSEDPDVVALKKKHSDKVIESNLYADWADEWADEENALALKFARTHLLSKAGLKYSEYFNEKGEYTEKTIPELPDGSPKWKVKRYKERNNLLNKAISFRVTPVTLPSIASSTSVELDYNNVGMDPEQHLRMSNLRSIWFKIASVAALGLVGLKLVNGGWESFYNGVIQLGLFILFGILGFYNEFIFMVNTYTGSLVKKINLLERLIIFGKKKEIEKKQKEVINDGSETRRFSGSTESTSPTSEGLPTTTSSNDIQPRSERPTGTVETTTVEYAGEQESTFGTSLPSE